MAGTTELVLVIHNHQPVGNFDHVFHEACDRAYLPFLRTLAEFPVVRLGLHTSGSLWEWVEQHRPEYGKLVGELTQRGQLELLGGAMYEPILPILPWRDQLWQLQRMNRFLQERFGVTPAGMWIPERVWEPQLPEVIARAGLRYCLLDDSHFEGCAPGEQVKTEYFLTRQDTSAIALFPISKELRYTIPFQPVEATLDYLKQLAADSDDTPLAVFGDDGEKFGIWPDTYEWVYDQGWLREFFQALTDNAHWLQIRLPSELLEQRQPAGTVYLPSRSYSEMGEWTRVGAPEADAAPGHWRNFLSKYPESGAMYERMCQVSAELHTLDDPPEEALEDLARAQCNCSYWHGVFGGLYLNYLRAAVNKHLLRAERAVPANQQRAEPSLRPNAGADGTAPILQRGAINVSPTRLRNSELSISLQPQHGSCISRLEYYPTLFCWSDVLARRPETYHSKLAEQVDEQEAHASIHDIVRVKEPGLEQRLVYDITPRYNFMTYFSDVRSPEQFMSLNGADRADLTYLDYFLPANEVNISGNRVEAVVAHHELSLHKSIELADASVRLAIEFGGAVPRDAGDFWVEFNLTVLADQADDRYLELNGERAPLNISAQRQQLSQVSLVDGWQQRRLTLAPRDGARAIAYPVYTISSSEGGFERTYQGTCIMLGFNPSRLGDLEIQLSIEEL